MDASVVDVAVEFLAVAFHEVLYYASVYPKSIFETRTKYGAVVYRCTHPDVNEYINMSLENITEMLRDGELYRVEFAVTDSQHTPGLKVVFEFRRIANYDDTADAYLVRCEQNMRAFCLQLATASHKFKGFTENRSFAVYLITNESTEVAVANNPNLENFPLIEVDQDDRSMDHIFPIRSFPVRNFNINTYLEMSEPWSFHS